MKIHKDKESILNGISNLKMVVFLLIYIILWYGLKPFLNLVSNYYLYSDYTPLIMGFPLLISLLLFPSIRKSVLVAFSFKDFKEYKIYIALILCFF